MPVLGPRLASDLIFAVGGMDAGRILNFQNRNGLNPQDIIGRAAAAVGAVNDAVWERWRGAAYLTNDTFARYRQGTGSARKTPKQSETATTNPIEGSLSGHMLPIGNYEDALAWSDEWLRDAYEAQIDADIQEVSDNFRYRAEADIVNRIFSATENAIGGGFDVPWAIGTGVSVPFIPPPYLANNFTSAHTHFLTNSGTNAAAALALHVAMVKSMIEHGYNKNLVQFISLADVDLWGSVTGFVSVTPGNITVVTGGSSPVNIIAGQISGLPGVTIGWIKTNYGLVELRYLELVPQYYTAMTASFGDNNPKNGIAVRIHPIGFDGKPGMFGMYPDVQVTTSLQPRLKGINLKATHGIGVNNRINGVVGQLNQASTYSWTAL